MRGVTQNRTTQQVVNRPIALVPDPIIKKNDEWSQNAPFLGRFRYKITLMTEKNARFNLGELVAFRGLLINIRNFNYLEFQSVQTKNRALGKWTACV